jgi:transcriptional regulator with XRE-family HTH domain
MNQIGHKLLMVRKQRRLSLRQVERLTSAIADRCNDQACRISASWLGRIERGNHSIAHKRLASLEEVYRISHDELADNAAGQSQHYRFTDVPAAVLKSLSSLGGPLLPPESWLSYFPQTTLLPPLSQIPGRAGETVLKRQPGSEPLYGILGANDTILVPFVLPGAVVEINTAVRRVHPGKIFHSIFERPIYFLRSHDGYHCGWCELETNKGWLTLVPFASGLMPPRRWRYRQEVEVIGTVNRVLTRLGFPKSPSPANISPDEHSNST